MANSTHGSLHNSKQMSLTKMFQINKYLINLFILIFCCANNLFVSFVIVAADGNFQDNQQHQYDPDDFLKREHSLVKPYQGKKL